jgi:hypothetical protein
MQSVQDKWRCKKHTELICIFKKLMKYRKRKQLVIEICYIFILTTRRYTVLFYLHFSSLKFFSLIPHISSCMNTADYYISFSLPLSFRYIQFWISEEILLKNFHTVIICLYSQIDQSEILFRWILNSKEFILLMIVVKNSKTKR